MPGFFKLILSLVFFLTLVFGFTSGLNAQTCLNSFIPVNSSLVDMGNTLYSYYPDRESPQSGNRYFYGGLFDNGLNAMPDSRKEELLNIVQTIVPLESNGRFDLVNGKIGFISVGMSNTRMGFGPFLEEARNTLGVNPKVKIVNTAVSSADALRWDEPTDIGWSMAMESISSSGLTPAQIQVVWLKQAIMGPQNEADHVDSLANYLINISRTAKQLLPNLKIIYMSSRTRSYDVNTLGTHQRGLNSEPYAFESAFAVRQVILEQMNNPTGRLSLNEAPFITWGPYLWIDGQNSRSDGLAWLNSDLNSDCTHPSTLGTEKVGQQLMNFFMTDMSSNWFINTTSANPSLVISANGASGDIPLSLNFSATTNGSQVYWNFGDGTGARGVSVNKTFKSPGNYEVFATAINSIGQVNKKSIIINATSVTVSPTIIPPRNADANGDGKVDGIDYIIWLNHYNQNTSNGVRDGDFNNSGRVDGVDYIIWLNNYRP